MLAFREDSTTCFLEHFLERNASVYSCTTVVVGSQYGRNQNCQIDLLHCTLAPRSIDDCNGNCKIKHRLAERYNQRTLISVARIEGNLLYTTGTAALDCDCHFFLTVQRIVDRSSQERGYS